jgi:hypothetical protein
MIKRPWLDIRKSKIYELSEALAIPYLKNTTPTWSNRGKFRSEFYPATHLQYSSSIDTKIIDVAERLKKQSLLIDKLLYMPVFKSWNGVDSTIDVTNIMNTELDGEGWSKIFEHICHKYLKVSKPSIHACRDFAERFQRTPKRIHLKKGLETELYYIGSKVILKFKVSI